MKIIEKQSLKTINKVQSKYNFTNSASKLLKDCQGVLSKRGEKCFNKKPTSELLKVRVLEQKTETERKLQRDSVIEDAFFLTASSQRLKKIFKAVPWTQRSNIYKCL